MNTERLKTIATAIRASVKLEIEKQDTRKVDNGNIFHAGTFTDEQGKEFPFTITEMKSNGHEELDITWCENYPWQQETEAFPYTKDGSEQDFRRATIGTMIVEQFTTMEANADYED